MFSIAMSLIELCDKGDLEGVKAALQRGADVNAKVEYGWTGLMQAVCYLVEPGAILKYTPDINNNHNLVVALLLVGEQGRVLVEPAVHVGLPVALVGQHVPAGVGKVSYQLR